MFQDLLKFRIDKIECGISFSFPIGLGAVLMGTRVLNYLHAQEKEDYKRSEYTGIKPGTSSFNFEAFDELRVRFLARITSYIITVCTIDGILKQSYIHFIECLKQMGYNSIIPIDSGKDLLRQRKEEIRDYLFYRHKVFAHTAFGSPKNDSLSLRHSSLAYFSGNLIYLKDKYFALGGGSLIVDKEENPPELSIVKGHPNLKEHYSLWERMFTDILINIPTEDLRSKIDKTELHIL